MDGDDSDVEGSGSCGPTSFSGGGASNGTAASSGSSGGCAGGQQHLEAGKGYTFEEQFKQVGQKTKRAKRERERAREQGSFRPLDVPDMWAPS